MSLTRKGTPASGAAPSPETGGHRRRLGPGPFEPPVDHGVELGIHRLDAGDGGVDQLQRLDLAGPNQPGEADGIVITQDVDHGADGSVPAPPRSALTGTATSEPNRRRHP